MANLSCAECTKSKPSCSVLGTTKTPNCLRQYNTNTNNIIPKETENPHKPKCKTDIIQNNTDYSTPLTKY